MAVRHIALLTLADDCDVDALLEALAGLPAAIPELRRYAVGRDLGISEGNATVAVVADVDDEAAIAAYRDHPAHRAVLDQRIKPWLVSRAAIQHEL